MLPLKCKKLLYEGYVNVKGNDYKGNAIIVSENKIIEKNVADKYENTEIPDACCRHNRNVQHCPHNDCYGLLDNNSKISCALFLSSHVAKIKFIN